MNAADGPLLAGVDLGTSGAKCGVYDLAGNQLGFGLESYRTQSRPGSAEQDGEDWWRATAAAIRGATCGLDAGRVAALAVGGQAPSPVAVDDGLRPVAPVAIWMDARAQPLAERLLADLGGDPGRGGRLGLQLAARAACLRDRHPGAAPRIRCILHSWDYLIARLTGRVVSSVPVPDEALAAAGVPRRLLPAEECATGEQVGALEPGCAAEIGLAAGLPVVAGGVDSFLGAVGSGIGEIGDACLCGGTSAIVSLVAPDGVAGRFTLGGRPLLSAPTQTSGSALEWVRRLVARDRDLAAAIAGAGAVAPGAAGLVFLPYLAGERAPIDDPDARGVFYGLTLEHGPEHLVRAVMEAVAFSQRHVLDHFVAQGAVVRSARVIGGQARHPILSQLKADVLGLTVEVPDCRDAATLGAAMLAAVALDLVAGPRAAARRMVRIGRRHPPDPAAHEVLAGAYSIYRQLYPRLATLRPDVE